MTRREALSRILVLGGAVALSALSSTTATAQTSAPAARTQPGSQLPAPSTSGIEHVVVMMMENRSFDHFLGWLPHA